MKKQNNVKALFEGLHTFILLWATQALSALGSSMTSYALVIWSYQQTGSALSTSLLAICSYAPYVLLSIFAGALSDRWNKKHTMLVCDTIAAVSTAAVFYLLGRKPGNLAPVFYQWAERPDEYHSAACLGCGGEPAHTEKTIPEGERYAFVFQLSYHCAESHCCHDGYVLLGDWGGDSH